MPQRLHESGSAGFFDRMDVIGHSLAHGDDQIRPGEAPVEVALLTPARRASSTASRLVGHHLLSSREQGLRCAASARSGSRPCPRPYQLGIIKWGAIPFCWLGSGRALVADSLAVERMP